MVRVGLLIVSLVVLAVSGQGAAAAAVAGCSDLERQLGLCARVDGGAVELEGWETSPGSPGSSAPGAGWPQPPISNWSPDRSSYLCLIQMGDPAVCVPPEAEPGIPTITIRDIAAFRPAPGRQLMEPDGWTVAGLDTNFYALTDRHVVPGTLLGRPAEVRFTPERYHWNYGDGSAATLGTKGATWAALGLREFDPTPTSHVYGELGDYTITLSITFTAEYRFDGGAWRPVVGDLTLPANELYLRVGTAKTVLVERDCLADPSGPGC